MKKPRFAPRQPCSSKLLIARITQSIRARKLGWFRTDSGTSYRLSKSVPPCPAERHYQSPSSIAKSPPLVNSVSRHFSAFSTAFLRSFFLLSQLSLRLPASKRMGALYRRRKSLLTTSSLLLFFFFLLLPSFPSFRKPLRDNGHGNL